VNSYFARFRTLGMSFDTAVICCCNNRCSLVFKWCSCSHETFVFSQFMNYKQYKLPYAPVVTVKVMTSNTKPTVTVEVII